MQTCKKIFFLFFLLFLLLLITFKKNKNKKLFLSIIKDIIYEHIGDRKENTLVILYIYIYIYFKHLVLFCYATATPYWSWLLWFAHRCLWLACNSGEMIIYPFFLWFVSPYDQNMWHQNQDRFYKDLKKIKNYFWA